MNTTQYGEKVNRSVPPINQDPDRPTVAAPGYSSGLAVGVEEGKGNKENYTYFPQPVMSEYSIYKDLVSIGKTNSSQVHSPQCQCQEHSEPEKEMYPEEHSDELH